MALPPARRGETAMEKGGNAALGLEDGTILLGNGFGAATKVSGEVVFNTSMVGYPELLTDPSYYEQIVVMTYPIVGSYGVPPYSIRDNAGVPLHFESDSIKVKGFVVHSLSRPSHWSSHKRLEDWLAEENVPGIYGVDTRALTQKLRTRGTMLGMLKVSEEPINIEEFRAELKTLTDPNATDLVKHVSPSEPIFHEGNDSAIVAVIDCGLKFGILRNLLSNRVSVVRLPYDCSADEILETEPCGVVISNGPGDPKRCERTIRVTRELLGTGMPIMGICLGTQILALAAGGDTYKLKFGHRAINHPCMDLNTGRCYITTQNHGYTVDKGSLEDTDFQVCFVNANDKTVEGIQHREKKIFGVQWHPESSPGPYDTRFLFDQFLRDALRH